MRFKKVAATLMACMAVCAVGASAAQANWFVNGTELGATSHQNVSVSGSGFTLSSTILGQSVVLKATGLECSGTCTIDGSSFGTNHSTGKLKFTGVTVEKPAHCSVPGGSLTTNALEDAVEMKTVAGSTNTFDKFFPAGTGTTFVVVTLSGAECILNEAEAPVKGSVYGESNETGKAAVSQPLTFNTASNSISTLTLGGNTATLTGSASNALSGTNVGASWDATE
jgi:hypothetical protein